MMKFVKFLAVVASALYLACLPLALAAPAVTVEPGRIDVGMDFSGAQVRLKGTAPEGAQLIIKATAPGHPTGLSKKGRVGGLWMTVESVTVDGMPGFFQVLTSTGMREVPPAALQQAGVDPAYENLLGMAKVTVKHEEQKVVLDPAAGEEYARGLVEINRKKGLYSIREGAVRVDGGRFEALLDIPAAVPRGDIRIEIFTVAPDGTVSALEPHVLQVASVGLVASLGSLARTNPVTYGILAVVIALATGLAIANLFKYLQKLIFKDEGVSAHH
ncbi:MAG: TIGR02186 family protein [Bacillota bacterium]